MNSKPAEWAYPQGTLRGTLSVPPSPRGYALLLHGFRNTFERCPWQGEIAESLYDRGIAVLRFDFLGSGASDGEFQDKTMRRMADQALFVANWYRENLAGANRLIIWGRSFGATITLLESAALGPARICAAAPTLYPTRFFYPLWNDRTSPYCDLDPRLAPEELKGPWRLSQEFFHELEGVEKQLWAMTERLDGIAFVQGGRDEQVIPEAVRSFHGRIRNPGPLFWLPDERHSLATWKEEERDRVIEWLAEGAESSVR